MSIITTARAKELLQIPAATTTYDNLISVLIPLIQNFICFDYCNNTFRSKIIYMYSSSISFVNSTKKILDSESGFLDAGLAAGFDILVEGSYHNNSSHKMIYLISTAAAGELLLTLPTGISLTDEDESQLIKITKVEFPVQIQRTVAKMINLDINANQNTTGIKSESIGRYSVTFSGDYPEVLLRELNTYRKFPV